MSTFKLTNVFNRLVNAAVDNKYLILYGGSSSSKTISILQYATLYAIKHPASRITLSAESMPVIKKTIYADWRDIVMGDAYDKDAFNKTEMQYVFPNGSVFNFVPADDYTRFKAMRQDICYFDEVNHIPKAIYDQADIRTSKKLISSFNPAAYFWLGDNFEDASTAVIHSTYKDNPYLEQTIIDSLEKRILTDKNFYNVYVLGKWGSLEGLVFEEFVNWDVTDTYPNDYKKRIIAGDFGYTNDPTVILDIRYANDELWIDEIAYKTGLLNSDIAMILRSLDYRTVFDSAEPKSIADIKNGGIDIHGALKGKDSINNGIALLKDYKINVTKRSINTIKELRNYNWQVDKEGTMLNKPIDYFNHSIDAMRYGAFDIFNRRNVFFK